MTRILFITKSRLSFSRSYSINILKTAESLSAKVGMSVSVLCTAPEKESAEQILAKKGIEPLFALDVRTCPRILLLELLRRRGAFDVLYFRDPFLWHVATMARFFLRTRIVFEAHGSHEWRLGWPFWRLSVMAAHGLVFITKALAAYYNPRKPSVVTHTHSFDKKLFDNEKGSSQQDLRGRLGLPISAPIILYAGSFLWYSWDVLLCMMPLIPEPAMLVLVGVKPEEEEAIRQMAREMNIASRLKLVSRVAPPLIPSYLRAADILVNPLRIAYPGSVSSKIYEYLAAGKPIVSSGGEANKEVLVHEVNALVAELTAQDFADAINRILRDVNLSDRLAQHAQESAQRFTWEKRAEDIASLITRVL